MSKALVIGYGSIGARHTRLLIENNWTVNVVSSHLKESSGFRVFSSIDKVDQFDYDLIVIANKTSEHYSTLKKTRAYFPKAKVLVEKPIFGKFINDLGTVDDVWVAYNFRFHPLVQKLKNSLAGHNVLQINMYVGQYLPSWRPEVDYRVSYSAKKEEGGGVLRDLSHELDLLNFLFGEWRELIACTGKKSSLEINSEDSINVLGVMKNEASFQISMNYTDRIAQRFIIVVTDSETFHIDLVKNTFKSSVRNENVIITRDISYIKMHQGICENSEYLCDFNAGLQVESLIEKVEESMKEKRWVKNGFV